MSISISFASNSKFYAEDRFPYGLSRSGEFTCEQVALLENHGAAYQALHEGLSKPTNEEERDFLKVCQGVKDAATSHERTWARFCEKTKIRPAIISAFGGEATSRVVDIYSDGPA